MSVFTFTTPTIMPALSGIAFPDHSHISESWNILRIPNYLPTFSESEAMVHYDDAVSAIQDLVELVETKGIGVNFFVEVQDLFLKQSCFWINVMCRFRIFTVDWEISLFKFLHVFIFTTWKSGEIYLVVYN